MFGALPLRRLLVLALAVLATTLTLAPVANAQDVLNCDDFETQQQVGQNDPNNLDADGDGIGCDNKPAASGGGQQTDRLANTGFEAWMIGLAGLALIGGAVALHRTGRAQA